jgi:starch-binding outer membrane protein, SusD/RagB family
MAAEAEFKVNGSTPIALEYYNQVKRRAYGFSPTMASAVDVTNINLQSIMDERSRELCFEGVRRSDLIRWGMMTTAMQGIVADVANNAPSGYLTSASLAANNYLTNPLRYAIFPIPANEVALNNAMVQNAGW